MVGSQEAFKENIAHLLTAHPAFSGEKSAAVGRDLGVSRTTVERVRNATQTPRSRLIDAICRVTGVSASDLYQPHAQFKRRAIDTDWFRAPRSVEPSLTLAATEKWRPYWKECHAKHVGTYLLYASMLKPDSSVRVAVAILKVMDLTDRGITVNIVNVDNRHTLTSHHVTYEYECLMFPIRSSIFIVGNEKAGDEPITIVARAASGSNPGLLSGFLAAIGVLPDREVPLGRPAVLAFISRDHSITGGDPRVGVFNGSQIPNDILRLLQAQG